ncbi:hypothetical protein VI817_003003 [Penicillium citrinum]|nr:hypothetical protein VI817_003003 [Penicillium citrinum]
MTAAWKAAGLTYVRSIFRISNHSLTRIPSYNRYLAIAARTVRRSLKETPRLESERRDLMDLRFAKWHVS